MHIDLLTLKIATRIADEVKQLTKTGMIAFFNHFISPSSPERAKLSIWMNAQATSDVSTKQITELVKALDLNSTETESQVATDLQARLSAAGHDEEKEMAGLKDYLLHDLKVAEDKIDSAVETWHKLHPKANGVAGAHKEDDPPSLNGTKISFIEDARDFKAHLPVSAGARPMKDLIEYEDLDPKL